VTHAEKTYAWDVEVTLLDGATQEMVVVAPTENQARRRASLRRRVSSVFVKGGMSEAAYRRAYGFRYREKL
jgi:hypothetical protein